MNRAIALGLAAIVVVAAVTIAVYRMPPAAPAPTAADLPPAGAASGQTPPDPVVVAEAGGASAPPVVDPSVAEAIPASAASSGPAKVIALPPEGLPLRESAAALIEAARAGNVAATRRLLTELTDCQRHRWTSLRMDMMIAWEDTPRGRRRGGERLQEMMSDAAGTLAQLDESCADLPDDIDEALLFEVQRMAADSGDLAGQLAFALAPALTLNKALLQMDRLAVYRERAPQYLQRALEQGSGQAVAALMEGYENYFEGWRGPDARGTELQAAVARKMIQAMRPLTPLQQVLGEDLAKAWTYATLCKRVCNGTDQARAEAALDRLRVAVDDDARRQAEDDAGELFDRHFAAKPRPQDIDIEQLREAVLGFRRM